jgi:hypothetical protein
MAVGVTRRIHGAGDSKEDSIASGTGSEEATTRRRWIKV